MYYCPECKTEFRKPKKIADSHNLNSPPFEKYLCCPFCSNKNIRIIESKHCKCCGAKLKDNESDYCSVECEKKGRKLLDIKLKKELAEFSNPINVIIRELNEYNKKNNTNYSYGQYIAYVKYSKKGKNNVKRKKDLS